MQENKRLDLDQSQILESIKEWKKVKKVTTDSEVVNRQRAIQAKSKPNLLKIAYPDSD